MNFDRLISPRLAQYLDDLPNGLGSHPQALTRADFSLLLRPKLDPFFAQTSLPPELNDALSANWKVGEWIPTVTYVALCAIARDVLWQSDLEFRRGMFAVATEMYKGPFLRTLFGMLGPSIVAMSAAKRWNTLHQGTTMVIKKQQKESIGLVLTFPKNLISEAGMTSLGAACSAAIEVSRGRDSSFDILSLGSTEAEFTINWTY